VVIRSTPPKSPPLQGAPVQGPSTTHPTLEEQLIDEGQGGSTSPTVLPDFPSTSAAPLSIDVAKNLQGGRPGQVTSSVHARLAQMGHASADAVKAQVDRFLANETVQVVGDALVEATRSGVDWFADNTDFLLSTKLLADAPALDEKQAIEAQQMWASGKVLEAVATKIEELIHLDEAQAFLAKGGSALFKVTSDLFELLVELAHKGAKGAAAGITLAGRFLKWLVGKDTLRSTALTVFGGARMNLISEKLNAGVGGGMYFPSFKQRDELRERQGVEPGKDSYFDVIAFDWGASAASPVAGAGWSSRGGAGAGVNLYFVSASFNAMTERVFIGVPGLWGVTLGRDTERGSEINFGTHAGLAGGPALGAYVTYGVSLHTPLLDPVNKFVTRPIARVIVEVTGAVVKGTKWAWEKLRGPGGTSEPRPTTSG
jgi:hypothetical protein